MKRLAALVLAGAIAACSSPKPAPVAHEPAVAADAGATPAARAPAASSEGRESKAIAKTLARVSRVRGLPALRPVPGVTLERGALVGRVKEKALREYPADALRREGHVLQMFGFAPPAFDYLGETMTLLEAQLEGFYEPENGTMYLAADLRGKEAQATLAHELVHALQDHHWDLRKRSRYQPGRGDETLALACLAEGDATSLMMELMMGEEARSALDLPDDLLRDLMGAGMSGAAIQSVPKILRRSLVAPYIDGLAFVHALRRKGGWTMVDQAWAEPPRTTEQVLHVDKWAAHEPALSVPAPSAGALGAGWRLDDEDTWGELGFALAFEEWLDHEGARTAAAGWGGDRSAVYTRGRELAFAVHARYDDAASARRAIGKLLPGLERRLGRPTSRSAEAMCFERTDLGPLVALRKDSELVLTTGPARAPEGDDAWSSASSCVVAKAWAEEIAGAR